MRITREMELAVLETIIENPSACITFPKAMYRADGSIVITRDNLSYRLHRYLEYRLTGVEIDQRSYRLPGCDTTGCQNPHHRIESTGPTLRRVTTHCTNGHDYTPENTLVGGRDRCKTCRDARLARRRTTPNQQKGMCRQGHKLTADNSYTWLDAKGRTCRRCKRCTLTRMRATRALNRMESK